MKKYISTLCILTLLFSCNTKKEKSEATVKKDSISNEKQLSKADSIINVAIEAHGGKLYTTADYSFVFRATKYRFQNSKTTYSYSSKIQKEDSLIKDVMTPDKFERKINNSLQTLNKKQTRQYSEALNSVIYFATLPHKLEDASVNKKFVEETSIKKKRYDVISVSFNQDGGGKDFDDEYQYWINKDTYKIDYLAYNYRANGGGVRFRAAFNTRVIDGITFQDYINYEAPLETPLTDLPKLYVQGKLKEVSIIRTENVVHNHK